MFLSFSVLGTVYNGYFFSFHLLNIVVNNQLLGGVIKSVTQNGKWVNMYDFIESVITDLWISETEEKNNKNRLINGVWVQDASCNNTPVISLGSIIILQEEKVMPGPSVDPPLITHIGVNTTTIRWHLSGIISNNIIERNNVLYCIFFSKFFINFT